MSDDIRAAHDLLAKHYGEEVLPVSQVCTKLEQFVQCLIDNESDGPYDEKTGAAVREHGRMAIHYATKSNLLFRLLYLGERPRTRKCPKHDGHWSGWANTSCECQSGLDVTGWLPNE